MEKIVVFILNYNGFAEIRAGSIQQILDAGNQIEGYQVEYVFLDNASFDGSIEYVTAHYPKIITASTFQNEGYVKGTNIGLKLCYMLHQPKYLLLVDSDNFCEKNAYAELIRYIDAHSAVAMVQPVVKSYATKKIISCGHVFQENGKTKSIVELTEDYCFDCLESCSISSTVIRTKALEEIGLLDEIYHMYYESTDLSFRLKQAGYYCACCKTAVTYNERATFDSFKSFYKEYYLMRNCLLLWLKYDAVKYNLIKTYWKKEYHALFQQYTAQKYITNYHDEAIRRALVDIEDCETGRIQSVIPSIADFVKTDVMLFSDVDATKYAK